MAVAAGASLVDPGPVLCGLIAEQAAQGCGADHPLGRLAGTLPLSRPGGVVQPFGVKIGAPGLDARRNTDLSKLEPGSPDHADRLRSTCAPSARRPSRAHQGRWTIRTSGLVAKPVHRCRSTTSIRRAAADRARICFECSGNDNPSNFGLMSVAEWDGIPLIDVVDALKPSPGATAVLVSGFDHDQPSTTALDSGGELGLPALVARSSRRVPRRADERRAAARSITASRYGWSCRGGMAARGSSG